MPADIFTRDGVEIRRLESGRCVLEKEWQRYIETNKVLRVPYMLENEPFKKLPLAYIPNSKRNHYPPMFRFGFAIPNHVPEFLRVALKSELGDPEKLKATDSDCLLRRLVMTHLNERCGLQPEKGVVCEYIRSKESNLLLEVATSYDMQIPEEKFDDVLRCIREVFSLSEHEPPKWYLGIHFGKDPDKYRLPMSAFKWTACNSN